MIISQVLKSPKLLPSFIHQYLLCICYNDGYCICYNDGELYSEIHFDSKWCVLLGIFPKFLLQLERKEHLLKNCNDVHMMYNFKCLWWNVTCLMNERLFYEVYPTILKPFCLFLLWNPQSDCLSFICILHSSKFSLSTFVLYGIIVVTQKIHHYYIMTIIITMTSL